MPGENKRPRGWLSVAVVSAVAAPVSGIVIGWFARLRGYRLVLPPVVGAVVGMAFFYLVFDNPDVGIRQEVSVFAVYLPVHACAYFLASWLQARPRYVRQCRRLSCGLRATRMSRVIAR